MSRQVAIKALLAQYALLLPTTVYTSYPLSSEKVTCLAAAVHGSGCHPACFT